MVIAALDTGNIDLADSYVHKLVGKFPDSVRVKRLEGMVMEYEGQVVDITGGSGLKRNVLLTGEYTEALELYATLLVQNPSNILIMKRKVGALIHSI